MQAGRNRRRLAGAMLAALGFAIAGAGAALLYRTAQTGSDVESGNGIRNGGLSLSETVLNGTTERLGLRAGPRANADELGALTFLHYALAEAAVGRGDRKGWIRELLAARASARQALALEPTRADVSLALAEIEFLLHGAGKPADTALELSFLTAPRELWIVERRIGLGFKLIATAGPDLRSLVAGDVRALGQPYRDTSYYRELARAAYLAGPAAIAFVRGVLATVHEQPLQIFDSDLAQMEAERARN